MSRFAAAVTLAALCVAFTPDARCRTQEPPKPAKSGSSRDIQEIQDVQEIKDVTPVASRSRMGLPALIGRMHPAAVHFPIAWVFLALVVEAVAFASRRPEWSRRSLFVLSLAVLSVFPAAITGLLRASAMGSNPEFLALMVPHRNLNLAAGILCVAALGVRVARRRRWEGGIRSVHLALIAAAAALMMFAGHLGGKMVFGSDYLPF